MEATASPDSLSPERRRKIWAPPNRPWEIELMIVAFVIVALAVPFFVAMSRADTAPIPTTIMEQARTPVRTGTDMNHVTGFLWAVAVTGVYFMHLTLASGRNTFNTTPGYYLVAPLAFAALAYFRLYQQAGAYNLANPLVSGSFLEISLWLVGTAFATVLLGRMRMLRHRIRFRNTAWDISTPTRVDETYYKALAWLVFPLVYPPRRYRACPDGLLIEGWLYLCPLPFTVIEEVDHVAEFNPIMKAEIYASSARNMIQIDLTDQPEPILISPRDHDGLLAYCRARSEEKLHVVKSKTISLDRIHTRNLNHH